MKNNSSASIIQLLATALITAALLAGSGCAVASTPDGPPTPTFTLTPTALNFGNQPVNTISSPQSVTLTNVGSLDVVISSVNITSGVFAVSGPAAPVTVRPGNSVVYNITFRPSAAQSYSGSLSFASNAPSSPSSVSLSGTGVAGTTVLNVSPTSISFGNQVVSTTSSPRSVMAANVGSTPITISGVTTNPPFAVSGFTGSTTLNAGQSLNLSVTFTPTAQTTYTGTLTITSTAPSSPDNVALSGVGVAVGASPYTAITDRLTRPLPSPIPTLGPAGSIITDPDFGMRILRVTDANTMPDQPGQGYQTASGAATKMFNSDNTRLIVASWGNRLLAYNFNPVNMTIQRIGNPSAPSGGDLIPLVGDGAFWSYTNRDIIYGINNGKMAKYDFSTNQLAILLDPTLLSLPGMTGTRADIAGVSNDDRYITWFGGGTSQNTDMYIIRYDQQTTSWRALRIDTGEIFAGTGNNPGTSQGFATANPNGLLHNARTSVDGGFVIFTGGSASPGIWEMGTANVNIFGDIDGHWAPGYARWTNHCQIGDGGRWCVQPYPQPSSATSSLLLPATILTPTEWVIDNHPSWLNDAAGSNVPICLATYRVGGSAIQRPWDDEVICVATGNPNNDTVWRFAHTFTSGTSWVNVPRGNVAQDGRFYMFNSDWLGAVGSGRADVFVVELK